MTQDSPRPASSSRWAIFQYSCRTLLLMMVVVSVFLAWWSDREKVTKRFQHLEDELTVLRAALGDSVLAPVSFLNSTTAASPTPASGLQSSGQLLGSTVSVTPRNPDDLIRFALYGLFTSTKAWLLQNLKDNRDWQEFLAVHPDPYKYRPPQKVEAPKFPVAKLFPVVFAMLRDGDSQVRRFTIQSLNGQATRFAKLANFVPAVIRVLDDKSLQTRCVAVRFIPYMGAPAKEALPRLTQLMNSSEAGDAVVAADAVAKIDPNIDLVPRLTELLSSNQAFYGAASLLVQLGPEKAAPAMPTLFTMLEHEQAQMRGTAAGAIGALAPRDEAIETLTEFLKKEKDQAVKMAMARIVLRLKAGVDEPQSQSTAPYSSVSPNVLSPYTSLGQVGR